MGEPGCRGDDELITKLHNLYRHGQSKGREALSDPPHPPPPSTYHITPAKIKHNHVSKYFLQWPIIIGGLRLFDNVNDVTSAVITVKEITQKVSQIMELDAASSNSS
jgi:hypothetical protein